ncbi:DnaD family protein [[Acholeplasma] multilocale]|uniref:DnaD family protein n=1 Tax=[Acholeplasma] multilocale TaxID=264638 RepID=UPI00047AF80F|nr:DnaD family protein [[Acholeplasma] multilocale]
MLLDLMKKGIVSKRNILLTNYKKIGLTENQTMIVMMIMTLSEDDKKFITPNVLSKQMNLSEQDIEDQIELLMEQDLVKVTSKIIDFSPLFQKIAIIEESGYMALENEDFVQFVKSKIVISDPELAELSNMINVSISENKLREIINHENVVDYKDLKKKISKELTSKPKSITRFNWIDN